MKCKGYALKSLAKALGLTQKDISDKLEVDSVTVRNSFGKCVELPNLELVIKGVLYETLVLSDNFDDIFQDFQNLYNGGYAFSELYNSKTRREKSRAILNSLDISKYHYVGIGNGRKRRKKSEL